MSVLTAPTVRKHSHFGWNLLYLSKDTSWTKLESLLIPNLHLNEKIGKEVSL